MKLLAFDQSTVKTGYAVFEDTELTKHGIVDFHLEKDTWIRAQEMFHGVSDLIKRVNPDKLVFEGVSLQTNPQVLIKLGQLQGEIMAVAWQNNIPVHIYLPTAWRKIHEFKQGKGVKRGDLKKQAISLVEESYGIKVPEDESEAIAIGLAFLKEFGYLPKNTDDKENVI